MDPCSDSVSQARPGKDKLRVTGLAGRLEGRESANMTDCRVVGEDFFVSLQSSLQSGLPQGNKL